MQDQESYASKLREWPLYDCTDFDGGDGRSVFGLDHAHLLDLAVLQVVKEVFPREARQLRNIDGVAWRACDLDAAYTWRCLRVIPHQNRDDLGLSLY